ncbi:MAG: hypothetical protein WAO20_15855 [Acidobacteriota bacterium]
MLPLKTMVVDSDGQPVTDTGISASPVVQITYSASGSSDAVDVSEEALPAGSSSDGNQFFFNGQGKWQFNLKTSGYTAPGLYTIRIVSGDESEYVINACEAYFVIEP